MTKTVTISKVLLFKEQESWDGTIYKVVGDTIHQPEDEEEEE